MLKSSFMVYKTLVVGVIVLLTSMSIVSSTRIIIKRNNSVLKPQLEESDFKDSNDTTPPVTTHSLDPPEPDGLNGWYVSNVTVTLNATDDMSGVKEIRYIINGWSEHIITGDNGSFVIIGEGKDILIEYWAVDWAGNVESPKNSFTLDIDQTPPEVNLSYEVKNRWMNREFIFTATATDDTSGMDRVEFYCFGELVKTVTGPGPTYIWIVEYWPIWGYAIIRADAIDKAGLRDIDEIRVPLTCSTNYLKNIQQNNKNINFLKISFDNLGVFLRRMKLSR